jgi:RNA polymerase sigma-B factor
MPLAKGLANRYGGGRESIEDLTQVASLGLVAAIKRFDPDRGTSFASFATPTILGELRRHFRDRGWSVRVPRALQERTLKVERAASELPTRLGRSPTVADIAAATKLSSEEVLEAMEAAEAFHTRSIDPDPRDEDWEQVSFAGELAEEDPGYELAEYGASLAEPLARLSARDRIILHLRFAEDMTQSEIAARVGVSQMHVSRILRTTVKRLREHAGELAPA